MKRRDDKNSINIEDLLNGMTPGIMKIEPSSEVRTATQFVAQLVAGLEENGFNREEAIKISIGIVVGSTNGK